MKDANSSTHIDRGGAEPKEAPRPPQSQQRRARPGSAGQQDNQRELGVGDYHLTEEMRKSKRGTFP